LVISGCDKKDDIYKSYRSSKSTRQRPFVQQYRIVFVCISIIRAMSTNLVQISGH
jgi:hypothetical protein